MNVVLVYNIKSGGKYDIRQLKKLFKEHGVKISYSFTIRQLSSQKLNTLVRRGVTVAVVGGDGTQNAVARLVAGTKSSLLPLGGGTFNHFVRDLGQPPTVEEALANSKTAKTRIIDVAYVNDELFLNNSNLGFYPFSLIEQKKTKKLIGKMPAAIISGIMQLVHFRRHSLVIDGNSIRSPFVFVGNNVFDINDGMIPTRRGLAKGTLTVMVATSSSRLKLLRSAIGVLRGDISDHNDFTVTHRKQLTIYSHHTTIPVSFDGELKRLAPPLEYRVAPKSLRVVTIKKT
jgi:diacylglycerol kinase family enzyme